MRALRLIDTKQMNGSIAVCQGNTNVVAVDGVGPVGDSVGVDFAAENAYGGGVAVVGRRPDCATVVARGRK